LAVTAAVAVLATAVDTDGYLARCMLYIAMNICPHPAQWGPVVTGKFSSRPPP
jgi:hypothetical protein